MKTCEEMTEAVFRIGEERLYARKKRKKNAAAIGGAALLLAAFFGIGAAAGKQKRQVRLAPGAQTAATSESYTAFSEEEPRLTERARAGEIDGAQTTEKPATDAQNDAANPPAEQSAYETGAEPARTEPPQTQPAGASPSEAALPFPGGAPWYSPEGLRRMAMENELAWLRIDGALYVHDAYAGTYENGAPKLPGDRLGELSAFEGNFGLFGVDGAVYTVKGHADDFELMVIPESGAPVFLIFCPE